jgi:hypothetical protein
VRWLLLRAIEYAIEPSAAGAPKAIHQFKCVRLATLSTSAACKTPEVESVSTEFHEKSKINNKNFLVTLTLPLLFAWKFGNSLTCIKIQVLYIWSHRCTVAVLGTLYWVIYDDEQF